MQIVIDIPEEIYIHLLQIYKYQNADDIGLSEFDKVGVSIKNGTPLPKGYGRLGDLDAIVFENADFDTYGDYCRAFDAIDQADTIIEADKAESEDNE